MGGGQALLVKAPSAKPDDLSSILETHMVGREKHLLKAVL